MIITVTVVVWSTDPQVLGRCLGRVTTVVVVDPFGILLDCVLTDPGFYGHGPIR